MFRIFFARVRGLWANLAGTRKLDSRIDKDNATLDNPSRTVPCGNVTLDDLESAPTALGNTAQLATNAGSILSDMSTFTGSEFPLVH